jgi:hypothetical protein
VTVTLSIELFMSYPSILMYKGMDMRRSRAKKAVCSLSQRLNELSLMLEKLKLSDYLKHLNNIKRVIWINFLGGLARGFGIAVGFTLLGALVIYLLQKAFLNNLPVIGNIIADIVKIANEKLQLR